MEKIGKRKGENTLGQNSCCGPQNLTRLGPSLELTMDLKFYTIKLKDRIELGSGFVSIHF
jgi:hypothetical protein